MNASLEMPVLARGAVAPARAAARPADRPRPALAVRARAPFRLGLAGGGTDVSPYADLHGGAVLNATIGRYAWVTLRPIPGAVEFESADTGVSARYPLRPRLPMDGRLDLIKAVHNRILRDHCGGEALGLHVTTYSEAPPGSGLGSSSTLVVALVQAYAELLGLPLGEYDVARLAYEIERVDMALAGGRQDQYAAAFGGFNFMEFEPGDHVIVNPLRIKPDTVRELESRTLMVFTGLSRSSAEIIARQSANVAGGAEAAIEAMHGQKANAVAMKEALLRGDLDGMAERLRRGWGLKQRMAEGISNDRIREVQEAAYDAGAYAGKVSGAGGGGFMLLFCPLERRAALAERLEGMGCRVSGVGFVTDGATAWTLR